MLAHGARQLFGVRLFLFILYICFFGLDSGGTNPDTR